MPVAICGPLLSRAAAGEAHTEVSAYRVMATLSMAWEQLALAGPQFWEVEEHASGPRER